MRYSNKKFLKTKAPTVRIFENSFLYRGIKLWNGLNEEIKVTGNFKHFKTKVKIEVELNNINFPE